MTNKMLQAVLTDDDLKKLDRDLRFHPATNENPKVLTKSQVEGFNKDGYVAPLDVYSLEEIAIRSARLI
jgi:hypothetical protein